MDRRFFFPALTMAAIIAGTSNLAANTIPSSPLDVVSSYTTLDFEGKRLRTNSEMLEMVTWEEEPGWDHLVLIDRLSILSSDSNAHSATITVQYIIAGTIHGRVLEVYENTHSKMITFELEKVSDTWKIRAPQIPPHVSTEIARPRIAIGRQ